MATDARLVRKIIVPSAFVIALFFLSTLGLLFPDLVPVKRLWRNYYTLLAPEEVPPARVVARLAEAGFSDVLAEPTAVVSYNAVVGMETVAVSDIHGRMASVDPRLDPYMARLPAFFRTLNGRRAMRVYFLRTDDAPFGVHRAVSEALLEDQLPGIPPDVILVEWGFWRTALLLGAFACYVLILVLRAATGRSAVAAAALLWTPWVVAGSVSTFLAACVSVFLFVVWLEELLPVARASIVGRKPEPRRFIVRTAFCGLGTAGIVAAVWGTDSMAALLAAGGGSLVLAGGLVYLYWARRRELDHPPFVPVDIMTPTFFAALRGRSPSPVPAVAPFVILPLLVLSFLPKTHSPFVPEPKAVVGAEAFDAESIGVLWTHEEQNALPDIADYLAHRAYQEGLLYGARYAVPEGRLSIPRFRYEADGIVRWEESVAVYDDAWYYSAVGSTPPQSVARLLVSQGGPTSVVFTPISVIFARGAALPGHIVVVLLVFAPFVVSFKPAASLDLLRGKRQEA